MLLKNSPSNSLIDNFLQHKIHYSTTVGDSMFPLLRNRKDRVVVKSIKGKVNLLDVVFYQRPTGVIILHRVIAIGKENYYICGDNQYRIEKVSKILVIGKLTSFYRGKKLYKTSNSSYVVYSIVWWFLFPIRSCFLFIKRKIIKNRN